MLRRCRRCGSDAFTRREVTASAGIAQLLDGMDDDALFRLADALLYEAKDRGRDQAR